MRRSIAPFVVLTIGAFGISCSVNPDPGQQTLVVYNYLNWCSVSVNGAAPSSDATQSVSVDEGTVTLSATPNAGFELGSTPWHDTDGDTGSGDPGSVNGTTSTTTITVGDSGACVWVCCETIGSNDCPTADLCSQ